MPMAMGGTAAASADQTDDSRASMLELEDGSPDVVEPTIPPQRCCWMTKVTHIARPVSPVRLESR